MNELKISYCIKCGADSAGYLTALGNGRYKCKYCSSEYREESAAKDIEHILSAMGWTVSQAVEQGLYAAKEEKLANARRYLYKATHEEYLSDKEIVKWADKVKAENAGDFLAEFYSVSVSKNIKEINAFLDGIDLDEKQDYLDDVIEFMLKTADYGNILSVENLIDTGIHDERQTAYLNRVHELAENLKSGLYDTEVPRDAFIAYSSKDFKAVNKIVTELEEQGLECFVAMRNLRHGKGARENYVKELQKAMNCCECFVFISSQNSRRPDCDAIKIELPYIRDCCKDKPRIEFVLDTVKTGNVAELKVKKFFDGLEYCRDITDLAERICLAMEGGQQTAPQQTISLSSSPKKYCVHCLTENDEDVRFCKECGKTEFAETLADAKVRYKALAKEEALREVENARKADEEKKAEKLRAQEEARTLCEKGKEYCKGVNGADPDYEKAAACFQKAIDMGNVAALTGLGKCHYFGWGVPQSKEKAVEYYRQAADKDDAEGQYHLGQCYFYGNGVEMSKEEGAAWYKKAAEQGNAAAQYNLGCCYKNGQGVPQSYEKAEEWCRKALEQGYEKAAAALTKTEELIMNQRVDAEYEKGNDYYEGRNGAKQDYAKAAEYYSLAAGKGHSAAQDCLGMCYYNGQGVAQSDKEAAKWLKESAAQGCPNGQYHLGVCYEKGRGVKQSTPKAASWYKKAMDQGHAEAKEALARVALEAKRAKDTLAEIAINDQKKRAAKSAEAEALYKKANDYYNGTNDVKQNYERAVELYLKAAEMGDADAQCWLGVCYEFGRGVTHSYKKAAEYYKKAADQGLARAQCNYGNLYYNGHGVEQSFAIAVEWYRKAAEQGYANAECWLGVCYEFGRGVEQSQQKAVEWYRKAAGKGNAAAQCNLGYCYEIGKGVTQDYAKAVEWYRKAAEQGHARAQCNLGICYAFGDGGVQDYAKAVEWYRKAAEQGHARAQCNLGLCYELGDGVTKDYAKAVEWYRKAAEQGDASAQYNLGDCYENGNGVRLSKNKAAEWYKKAAAQGYSGAEEALKRVSR